MVPAMILMSTREILGVTTPSHTLLKSKFEISHLLSLDTIAIEKDFVPFDSHITNMNQQARERYNTGKPRHS
jgi:hypothetical protein